VKTGLRVPRASRPRSRKQRGFVLIGVLIVLALAALAAVQTGQRWADTVQRANEEELLFVGEQYRSAIQSYASLSPNGVRSLPARLDDLVEDVRFPVPRRHLRKLFVDPLAPATPWGLVTSGNAVIGVYSQADGVPFRQTGFSAIQVGFDDAQRYADWRFVAKVPLPTAPGVIGSPGAPAAPSKPGPSIPGGPLPPTATPRGPR
jgi:type II secretory pathway pseudopilin PulG